MQWVLDNWIWLVFGGGMAAMHLVGHGKRGGHGSGQEKSQSCCGHREKETDAPAPEKSILIPKSVAGIGTQGPKEKSNDL
ncbi:hypothetical protein MNBD_ALPHA09-1715 [hydrothermal vent metagenome]|uniref:Uncharacterized protein n=1 Tax=hydrothermal vent metagenome TaxID=652676 RepID=A0A3B0UCX8_9ZZZZ